MRAAWQEFEERGFDARYIRGGVSAWYAAAKFGIFIHWGVYSVPAFANEWYPDIDDTAQVLLGLAHARASNGADHDACVRRAVNISGAWLSELLPHTARVADELCFIKSMHTGAVNHAAAQRHPDQPEQ